MARCRGATWKWSVFPPEAPLISPTALGCLASKIFLIVTLTPFPQHSLCSYTSGALMGINFHPQMAEKMAPSCMARLDMDICIRFRKIIIGHFDKSE